jgi:3',5'-cyclic AMP phosphodiesterase CpdA
MSYIAHLSDCHIIEDRFQFRGPRSWLRLSFLSFGRRLDACDRKGRLRDSLRAIKHSPARHTVITGDLTEDGTEQQFETLAEILIDSGIDPNCITLTAGNHDAYENTDAFEQALKGPLKPFAKTSKPGSIVDLGDVVVVPISTVIAQPYTRSAGMIPDEHLRLVSDALIKLKGTGRTVIIAQHHAPFHHPFPAMQWIDGLQNYTSIRDRIENFSEAYVLHGHHHSSSDRPIVRRGPVRSFGTGAVVSCDHPLRFYETYENRLYPVIEVYRDARGRPTERISIEAVPVLHSSSRDTN